MMSDWTTERVLQAAAEWIWVPADADEVKTADYHLIRYPDHFQQPTQVAWCRTDRPLDEVIEEVLDHVRRWGRSEVFWWTSSSTRPPETEAVLQARGATAAETVQVLAHDLSAGLPPIDVPRDVRVELVRDRERLRALQAVNAEVWDAPPPDEELLSRSLLEVEGELANWSGFRVLAWIGAEPVSFGGCTLAGDVARLWGAGTRPAWERRGAYRAVLAERLRVAREHGATLALVKGRVETSAPILARVGFTPYGEERCYRLSAG